MNEEGPVDFLGKPIEIGCSIVYPIRRRAELYFRQMRVDGIVKILTTTAPRYKICGTNDSNRRVTVLHPVRCIVVKAAGV